MPAKSLADGHVKFALLTTKPVIPRFPTAVELDAGIQAELNVLASDFSWTADPSDTVNERPVGLENNSPVPTLSNYSAAFTAFRYYDDATGQVDVTGDIVFQTVMVKGTRLWGYVRKNGKPAAGAWAEDDELWLGLEFLTDTPAAPADGGGYIKARVVCLPQVGYPFTAVGPVVV